ncbi:rhodanese domain-containing protein CG4456-like [Hyposmocoma kahamanoa]|uniref:rhodanese domain-containing protein CG4456-like n=1 Tax=Hyposmocoma kahamanoa TaxID=1477025 RepID=UPI000E6D5C0F|nr:rhodanese domain-containing protein CG4456-like [Hyposmocoma kahamanoa]
MFPRLVIRSVIPTTYRVGKVLAGSNLKQCFSYSTLHFSRSISRITWVSQRRYSKQVVPETIVVDYEYVRNSIADCNKLIVDVREPEEIIEHGKIPNSINIPLGNVVSTLTSMSEDEFRNLYNKPKPTEHTIIIFYCMIGKRSGMAQQNAYNLGYKNVKNYLGSWTEWAAKAEAKTEKL